MEGVAEWYSAELVMEWMSAKRRDRRPALRIWLFRKFDEARAGLQAVWYRQGFRLQDDAEAKEIKARTAVQGPLDQFETVHISLHWAIARQLELTP